MKAVTLLLLSGIGVALLGASSASAAPANGAIIGEAATASEVTQKVLWRGRAWGWRGGWGWRGWGWRPGLAAAGLATGLAVAATAPAWGYGWGSGWGPGWGYAGWGPAWGWGPGWGLGCGVGWRPGWRVAFGW